MNMAMEPITHVIEHIMEHTSEQTVITCNCLLDK